MRLVRELRFSPWKDEDAARPLNTWAGDSGVDGLLWSWTLQATVEGSVDEQTGYLCDIKAIDAMLETEVAPRLRETIRTRPGRVDAVTSALPVIFESASAHCPAPATLRSLALSVSPFTRLTVTAGATLMVHLTRAFEFSAGHRLHCEGFSDEENRRIFGKCSNPHGHGHNYLLEVTVAGPPDGIKGTVMDPPLLDKIVKERVIDAFDHKNLNAECDDFASLNPSVENIARVIWRRLSGAFSGCRLHNVRVWETPKTCAEYAGED